MKVIRVLSLPGGIYCPECGYPNHYHRPSCYHADCDEDDWGVHDCGPALTKPVVGMVILDLTAIRNDWPDYCGVVQSADSDVVFSVAYPSGLIRTKLIINLYIPTKLRVRYGLV